MAKLPIITTIEDLTKIKSKFNKKMDGFKYRVYICSGGGCISSNCHEVKAKLMKYLEKLNLTEQVNVVETGCIGTCALGPVMVIAAAGKNNQENFMNGVFYTKLEASDIKAIVESHLLKGIIKSDKTYLDPKTNKHIHSLKDIDYFKNQIKIALRNCGSIDYSSLEEYIANGGYMSAAKALLNTTQQEVVDVIKNSGLRGRGGAGFPTGIKWESGLKAKGDIKYLVCNADEGDPGAFMDRSILEGDPHSVIEGMLIAAFAIGSQKGYVYVRAEYPIAIDRLESAIKDARASGLLGENIFNSGFNFDIEIRIGAGAFVCGEETALMSSIEGKRGEPRQKPPLPFEKGLFGKPTIINNVETYANVPVILERGSEWFAGIGTEKSKGTKVFALAGDICNTGIIEVPMGVSLGEILFDIGGGIPKKKKFKAAQTGGPSGGCIPKELLNTPIDYDSLSKLGTIMGSGGLISMDEDTCMVDMARFFLEFVKDESCGKCVPCRLGTKRMLEILERITRGEGREGD
ncbi:MAG: NuoF family protein, partial [Clostridia bacterium]